MKNYSAIKSCDLERELHLQIDPSVCGLRVERAVRQRHRSSKVTVSGECLRTENAHRRGEILVVEEVSGGDAEREVVAVIRAPAAEHATHSATSEAAKAAVLRAAATTTPPAATIPWSVASPF